jgi:hypothetical protein
VLFFKKESFADEGSFFMVMWDNPLFMYMIARGGSERNLIDRGGELIETH